MKERLPMGGEAALGNGKASCLKSNLNIFQVMALFSPTVAMLLVMEHFSHLLNLPNRHHFCSI